MSKAPHEEMSYLSIVRVRDPCERVQVALDALRGARRLATARDVYVHLHTDLATKRPPPLFLHRRAELAARFVEQLLLALTLRTTRRFPEQLGGLDVQPQSASPRSVGVEVVVQAPIAKGHDTRLVAICAWSAAQTPGRTPRDCSGLDASALSTLPVPLDRTTCKHRRARADDDCLRDGSGRLASLGRAARMSSAAGARDASFALPHSRGEARVASAVTGVFTPRW